MCIQARAQVSFLWRVLIFCDVSSKGAEFCSYMCFTGGQRNVMHRFGGGGGRRSCEGEKKGRGTICLVFLHLVLRVGDKKNSIYLYAHIPIHVLCIVSQIGSRRILDVQRDISGRC